MVLLPKPVAKLSLVSKTSESLNERASVTSGNRLNSLDLELRLR